MSRRSIMKYLSSQIHHADFSDLIPIGHTVIRLRLLLVIIFRSISMKLLLVIRSS